MADNLSKVTNNIKKDLRNKIKKEVRDYTEKYCVAYCQKAADEITEFAKSAIYQFYNDYTPSIYDRTYDLRDNSYKRYYHNNGHGKYYGGVRITSEDMSTYQPGTVYETDPFEVVTAAYNGWHGDPIRNIYTTPPLEIIREKMKDKKFLNSIEEYAINMAAKGNYEIIKDLI